MEEHIEALVETTYQALVGLVQTTAVSKRVLYRPPFTFLHKLLVETLAQYGIFTPHQLVFAELATKEDKAAFLTRALAFVGYTMANLKEKSLSVLLTVSPVKVLAGVSVEDTLEFLQQLCVVCKSSDVEAREDAAKEVLAKGDAQLYTAGVTFRKGLILIQAIVRAFISRRVGKRKAAGVVTPSKSSGHHYAVNGPISLEVGTRFLKELSNGRVYDGIISSVEDKRYKLKYDQDPEAQDDVDEIEMRILLEESRRLHRLRERIHNSASSRRVGQQPDDTEHLLTSLPDLSSVVSDDVGKPPRLMKRDSSARGFERLLTPGTLARSPSSRQSIGTVSTQGTEQQQEGRESVSRKDRLGRVQSQVLSDEDVNGIVTTGASPRGDESDSTPAMLEKPWQASLKQILARGQRASQSLVPGKKASIVRDSQREDESSAPPNNNAAFLPSFPELTIPGTKKKLPAVSTRKLSVTESSKPPAAKVESSHAKQSESSALPVPVVAPAPAPAARVTPLPMNSDAVVDRAFAGTYQSTDLRTQEKLVLFREIVHRIDGYMKRKHLRVIDLFRFCDADGNGSISPQEMIDTLSQMEIQLSPEQAHDFIHYIDKDGNGSIDIDEFEELVRVARRSEAQREQLKKELAHPKRDAKLPSSSNRFAPLIKHRQRILDDLKQLDLGDVGTVSVAQAKSAIVRMQIPGIDEPLVNELLERSVALADSTASSSSSSSNVPSLPLAGSSVYLHHVAKALYDLEWSKRSNRFLDPSWLAQFDSQLERAYRDFELL